tara:strand:- start:373 stop:951 length:579 start_codon:yes stop_codon:yes gene_type:complete
MAYKQHFIEWFSGKQLPSYWNVTTTGTSTGVMSDEIDGGFKLNAWGGANNQYVSLTFSNKRQYAHLGSKFIAVVKANISTNGEAHWFVTGLMSNDYNSNSLAFHAHTSNANYGFYRSGYTLWSSVPKDSNWHSTEIESAVASDTMKIDGVLEATSTAYRPTVALQPMAFAWHGYANGTTADGSLRYMEAYNT